MDAESLMTIPEAARRLGERTNLVRAIIQSAEIPTRRIGRADTIDAAGLAALKAAVEAWHNRPRPFARKVVAAGR